MHFLSFLSIFLFEKAASFRFSKRAIYKAGMEIFMQEKGVEDDV